MLNPNNKYLYTAAHVVSFKKLVFSNVNVIHPVNREAIYSDNVVVKDKNPIKACLGWYVLGFLPFIAFW